MKTKILLAAACGIAMAIPALAAMEGHGMHAMMKGPMTRSAVEAMIKTHFAKVDANGDGYIVKAEAEGARDKMAGEMRDKHFKAMDANGDGSISRAEFDAQHGDGHHDGIAMGEPNPGAKPEGDDRGHMRHGAGHGPGKAMMMRGDRMFERADADKDGRVSLAEATALPMAHFDKVDANKDGTITPEERRAAHEKMRAEWRAKRG